MNVLEAAVNKLRPDVPNLALELGLKGLRLRDALVAQARLHDGEPCWCQVAIGNPMMQTHSSTCLAARSALKVFDEPLDEAAGYL